jgi:hypothetical protein
VNWNRLDSPCALNCCSSSRCTRTTVSVISSPRMRVGSITNMFETGYGQHEMITRAKWKTRPCAPEKVCYQNLVPLVKKFFPTGGTSDKKITSTCWQCASWSFKNDSKLSRTWHADKIPMSTVFSAHLSVGLLPIRKIKSACIGQQISGEIDLLDIVTWILDNILDKELQVVFCSWIECIQNVIDANEDYISK